MATTNKPRTSYPVIDGIVINPGVSTFVEYIQTSDGYKDHVELLRDVMDFILEECNALSIDEEQEVVMKKLLMVRDIHNLMKAFEYMQI